MSNNMIFMQSFMNINQLAQ